MWEDYCINCGCIWSDHVNSDIIYIQDTKTVTYDVAEKRKQHDDGLENLSNAQVVLGEIMDK